MIRSSRLQSKITIPQNIIFGRHKVNVSKVVQKDGNNTTTAVSTCENVAARTKQRQIVTTSQMLFVKPTTYASTKTSAIWEPMKNKVGRSNSIQTRQRLECGKRLPRSNKLSIGATGDRQPTNNFSTQTQWLRTNFYSSECDQESRDLSGWCWKTQSLWACHFCSIAFSCTTHPVVFRFFFALPFAQHNLLFARYKNLDGSSPIYGALKCTSLSRYIWHRSSSTSKGIDRTPLCWRSSPLLLIFTASPFHTKKMSTSGHVFDTITMNVPYPWWLCNRTHEGSWFFSRHHPKSWSWLCSRTTCMFWQETMHMLRKSIQHCLHSRFLVKTEPINGMVHFFHDILQRWHWSHISIVDSLLPCWSCKDNTSKDTFSQCEQ